MSTEEFFVPSGSTNLTDLTIYDSYTTDQKYTTVSELELDTDYYFLIRSYDVHGLYTDSNRLQISTLDTSKPPPVTAWSEDVGVSTVTIKWTTYEGDFFYLYEVHISTQQGFQPGNSTYCGTYESIYYTSMDIIGLESDTTYYAVVVVMNTYEYWSPSNEISFTTLFKSPPAPVDLDYDPPSSTNYYKVKLKWTVAETDDFQRYEIHYSQQEGFYPDTSTLLAQTETRGWGEGHVNSYSLTSDDFDQLENYYFIVRTVDIDNVYSDSNEIEIFYDSPPPSIPTDSIKYDNLDSHGVDLYWDQPEEDVPDFHHYEIWYREGVVGDFKKLAEIDDVKNTHYRVKNLESGESYYFLFYVVDESGYHCTGVRTTQGLRTESDFLGDFGEFLPCASFFFFIIFINILVALNKAYGAKAATWGIPIAIYIGLFVVIMGFDFLFEVTLPSWWLYPLLFVLCIIFAVVIGVSHNGYEAYKKNKWRQEQRMREEEERRREFEVKRGETYNRLNKMESRLKSLRKRTPSNLFRMTRGRLDTAWNFYNMANKPSLIFHVQSANSEGDEAERLIVEVEAFLIAREQAENEASDLGRRITRLEEKKAPRIAAARTVFERAVDELNSANDLTGIRCAIDTLHRCRIATDESESSLKTIEKQVNELLAELSLSSDRVREFKEMDVKDVASLKRLSGLISESIDMLKREGEKPDPDTLSAIRSKVREATELIGKIDEDERERQILLGELDDLEKQINEVASWTIASVKDLRSSQEKAFVYIESNKLVEARREVDRNWERLEEIKQNNKPKLVVVPNEEIFIVKVWEDFMVHVRNNGTAAAEDINVDFSSPDAKTEEIDEGVATIRARPREDVRIPISVNFGAEGNVPVRVVVHYKDQHGNPLIAKKEFKVRVKRTRKKEEAPVTEKKVATLKVIKRADLKQGFFMFKVSIKNKGKWVARDVNLRLIFDEKIFRIHHVYPPEFKITGESVDYGDIDPMTTTSVEFYLEAHMCTETWIDGVISYKDVSGAVQSMSMGRHKETLVCPAFVDVEHITPAQVKYLFAQPDWRRDTKSYAIPSTIKLDDAFEIMKEAIEKQDENLRYIFDTEGKDPKFMEAWYYGETQPVGPGKGIQHIVVGRVETVGNAAVLQITGASTHSRQMFALSARIASDLQEGFQKGADLVRPIQQIFYTDQRQVIIKDSVIQRSSISLEAPIGTEGTIKSEGEGIVIEDSVMIRSDIEGDKPVKIEDSVVQRSKIGEQKPPEKKKAGLDPEKAIVYKAYKSALVSVYEDKIVTMDERNMLRKLREEFGITLSEHELLEEEILREMGLEG
jgi:hypothetical protein